MDHVAKTVTTYAWWGRGRVKGKEGQTDVTGRCEILSNHAGVDDYKSNCVCIIYIVMWCIG